MTAADLDAVAAIEQAAYPHPWTRGNFSDSLEAGYHGWILECGGEIAGYTIVMIAADEAHILNLTVGAPWQRRGLGRELLAFALRLARDYGAHKVFLEVRPSNSAALSLSIGPPASRRSRCGGTTIPAARNAKTPSCSAFRSPEGWKRHGVS
jgi:ribosomal-protein-alanine N-acetyltransferase